MLSNHLFRALPPTQMHGQESYDMDEEEPNLDPAWPHLQVCVACTPSDIQGPKWVQSAVNSSSSRCCHPWLNVFI